MGCSPCQARREAQLAKIKQQTAQHEARQQARREAAKKDTSKR